MKLFISILILIAVVAGAYFLIGSKSQPTTDTYGEATLETPEIIKEEIINNTDKKFMKATLHTSMGEIVIELDSRTPNTVGNFTKLASEGFYDGTKFHRVIAGFMNQGGDPLSKDDSKQMMWGTGGPGYKFADEIMPTNSNITGTISMANAGPNTNGSQFFINVADNNGLDTKHTVFGRVTDGMDVVMEINTTETDQADRPLTPVVLEKITLE